MKKASWVFFAVTLATAPFAQDAGQNGYTVASRSAHQTVWQRVSWSTNRFGDSVARTNEFVELATGLNYFDEAAQQWQPSREEWVVYLDGIVARWGQHNAILSHNLADGVDVLLPDGVTRLMATPVSLGFYDPVDGKQVVIAEVKDCAPERGPAANEIVFRNCFDRIRGSIRYLYTKAGVHQHVVLEQKLELPEGFSEKSRLECYTVFAAETPWPQITTRVLRRETNPVLRAQMVEPDFTDAELDFGGGMAMRAGTAFSLGEEVEGRTIQVGKQFIEIEGQPVLIEAVEFRQVEPLLARLASVERADTLGLAINSTRQIKRAKEQAPLPREHYRGFQNEKETQLASHPLREPAVVIDYELLAHATNFTFKGDTTCFVSSSVNLSGTSTIEGGTVVKSTNSAVPKINVSGPIRCLTGPYRPALFVSKDFNGVGETLPGSTGNPTNYYGNGLVISDTGNVLHDLRFMHAASGVTLAFAAGQISLTNVQFVKCQYPIDSAGNDDNTIIVDNGLFYSSSIVVRGGEDLVIRGQHWTVNQCDKVGYTGYGSGTGDLYLTNSVVVATTNGWGEFDSVTTNSTAFFTNDPGGIFQTVGAASHYLANTNYRNAGTFGITIGLRFELQKKTTYPPVEITTNFTGNTILSPQAERDTSPWDLGFHYDPLDFVVSGRTLTNSTLTLTNGVALGTYGNSSTAGISIRKGGNLVSEGAPANLNRIVRYDTVQEQATTNWSATSVADCVFIVADASPVPQASFRFTAWSLLGGRGYNFKCYAAITNAFIFRDCEFGPGFFDSLSSIAITNCLVDRMNVLFYDDDEPVNYYSYNSLFHGGSLSLYRTGSGSWQFKDNLFDQTVISQSGTITHDYNGYVSNTNRLSPDGAHDVVQTNIAYQTGPLGRFYQLTYNNPLNNFGSRDAYSAGLFHYTTSPTQVMETNSTVDIGFHYLALSSGVPPDTDGDGIPDYADPDSDSNDGLPDWWEQKYTGGLAETPSGDFDGDCLTNLFEYQQGSNPADQPGVAGAPVYQIIRIGANASFSVTMTQACLSYQWYHGSAAIAGATNTSLMLPSQQQATNVLYKVVASSRAGDASPVARLVVLDGPAWTIWTNHLAHTNNKTINLWSTYSHTILTNAPTLAWDTNSLLYGKTGFTAISQANSFQGKNAPVTALTRRHGFTAGHSLSPNPIPPHYYTGLGGHTNTKIWFCSASNQVVAVTNAGVFVRYDNDYDYAVFVFTEDLTNAITPMSVTNPPSSIGVRFRTCQHNPNGPYGYVSANMPPFDFFLDASRPPFNEINTATGGDSGSPHMIPTTDGSLVFIGATSTRGVLSTQMQMDMDFLCTNDTYNLNLNITNYQLNWHTNYP